MQVFLTDHAKEQIKKRWKGETDPLVLAATAWEKGTQMNDKQIKIFFNKWVAGYQFKFFPEVRSYKGFEFLFQRNTQGDMRLVTMYNPADRVKKRGFRWWKYAKRRSKRK